MAESFLDALFWSLERRDRKQREVERLEERRIKALEKIAEAQTTGERGKLKF